MLTILLHFKKGLNQDLIFCCFFCPFCSAVQKRDPVIYTFLFSEYLPSCFITHDWDVIPYAIEQFDSEMRDCVLTTHIEKSVTLFFLVYTLWDYQ